MNNPTCEKTNKAGDCLARGLRVLCASCESLLSADELREREARFLCEGWRRKTATALSGKRAPKRCTKRRWPARWENGVETKPGTPQTTCIDRLARVPCPGCISHLTDAQLHAYALRTIENREELQRYWDEYREAELFAREMNPTDPHGFNSGLFTESLETALAYTEFHFSNPCHVRTDAARKECAA